MNAQIRKAHAYSTDPIRLAEQVGELARDIYARTAYELSEQEWAGLVTYGSKFRLNVGRSKPIAVIATDVEDTTNRSKLIPGGVRWQWVDGQVQVDDMGTAFSDSTEYRVSFLVIHRGGA